MAIAERPELGTTYGPDPERSSIHSEGEKNHDILYDVLVGRDISRIMSDVAAPDTHRGNGARRLQ